MLLLTALRPPQKPRLEGGGDPGVGTLPHAQPGRRSLCRRQPCSLSASPPDMLNDMLLKMNHFVFTALKGALTYALTVWNGKISSPALSNLAKRLQVLTHPP